MPRELSSEGKSRPQAIAAYLSGHAQPLRLLLLGRTAPLTRLAASGVLGPVVQDLWAGWTETILEQPWHPTARITSRSSMPSAPAAVPAMIDLTLPAGFTAAEATRVVPGSVTTLAETRSDSPARPPHHRHQTSTRHQAVIIERRRGPRRLSRTPLNFGGGPRDRQAAITVSS
jgi:hypothetical protein